MFVAIITALTVGFSFASHRCIRWRLLFPLACFLPAICASMVLDPYVPLGPGGFSDPFQHWFYLSGFWYSLALSSIIGWPVRRIIAPKPPPTGHCHSCGCNLSGNVSGQCPECGAATENTDGDFSAIRFFGGIILFCIYGICMYGAIFGTFMIDFGRSWPLAATCGLVLAGVSGTGFAAICAWKHLSVWVVCACPVIGAGVGMQIYYHAVGDPVMLYAGLVGQVAGGIAGLLIAWMLRPAVVLPGHCGNCGYNLTGNVSGRCPECGEAVADGSVENSD